MIVRRKHRTHVITIRLNEKLCVFLPFFSSLFFPTLSRSLCVCLHLVQFVFSLFFRVASRQAKCTRALINIQKKQQEKSTRDFTIGCYSSASQYKFSFFRFGATMMIMDFKSRLHENIFSSAVVCEKKGTLIKRKKKNSYFFCERQTRNLNTCNYHCWFV